jgi:sodium/proline symporter
MDGNGLPSYISELAHHIQAFAPLSEKVDAITIPGFFSNRFHENKKVLMTIAAIMIIVFFITLRGQLPHCRGKLFQPALRRFLHQHGHSSRVLFWFILHRRLPAESASDFLQAIVMIIALLPCTGAGHGRRRRTGRRYQQRPGIPGFLSLITSANPPTCEASNGIALSGRQASIPVFPSPQQLAWA